jgi:hypothetical protein
VAVTVATNNIAVSKNTGSAVGAFPDVCTTPAWPAPLPLPYPGVTYDWRASQTKAPPPVGQKVAVKGSSIPRSRGDEAGTLKGMVTSKQLGATAFVVRGAPNVVAEQGLRSHLSRLHNDMLMMRADNPELWHAAIDNYVRLVAELYKARASS